MSNPFCSVGVCVCLSVCLSYIVHLTRSNIVDVVLSLLLNIIFIVFYVVNLLNPIVCVCVCVAFDLLLALTIVGALRLGGSERVILYIPSTHFF